MEVSVIIPTYNGAHKIPGIIHALEAQTFKDFGVIVIVDGSTDNTVALLKSLKPRFKFFKIVEQTNQGRAIVRNRGAQEANDGLLIFFDDDMVPDFKCLETHVEHHAKFPGSIVTGAQIDMDDPSRTDIELFKHYLSIKWLKHVNGYKPLTKNNVYLTAANFSIRKDFFLRLGGFDERLRDAEDYDLGVRAYKEGVPLYYNHSAFAFHNDRVTFASYVKRQRQYLHAHETLLELKPWLYKEGFMHPAMQIKGWRKLVYNFFALPFWIKAVDEGTLKGLPKTIRYKLYEVIIAANSSYIPEKVKM